MKEGIQTNRGVLEPSWHRRWQDRLLDGSVTLFALWTLASHATVATGGTLGELESNFVALLLIAGSLGILLWRNPSQLPQAPTSTRTTTDAADVPPASSTISRLRLMGVVLGFVAVLGISRVESSQYLWWWIAIPLVLAAGALLWIEGREGRPIDFRPPVTGLWREILPWVLAVLAVGLTLVAHRHDTDDSVYINLAVSAVDHPDQPILTGDTMHGIDSLPLHLPLYKLHSFEMLCASLTKWTGLPTIAIFHFLAASFAAFLVPLAFARLFRLLTPKTWPWMLVFFLVVLVAVGQPHRWYGNFAFVRLWQGKSLFLFVALPLIYSHALTFARRPSWKGWFRLSIAQIAALGLSATALTHAPIGVIAAMTAILRPGIQGLLRLAAGAASSFYLISAGLLIREKATTTVRLIPREVNLPSGERLQDALAAILGGEGMQLFALAVLVLAWALTQSALARRFALMVPLVIWFSVLNPFTESLTLHYVTGTLYWRALWMLPVPLLIALVLTAPLEISGRHRTVGQLGATALLLGFIFLAPSPHGLSESNRVRLLAKPEFKIHPATYDWAHQLQILTGPDVHVVAPAPVGIWLPTFHHHAHPLAITPYLGMQRHHLPPDEWLQRDMMTRYVDGKAVVEEHATEVFQRGLEYFDVKGVCLRVEGNEDIESARKSLEATGFHRRKWGSKFEVWNR